MATHLTIASLIFGFAITGCGDGRLGQLSEGIQRDSVQVLMGGESPTRQESFLVRGQFWEVLYFAEVGAPTDSTVSTRTMSPVVLVDGAVEAWGWGDLEDLAEDVGFMVATPEE